MQEKLIIRQSAKFLLLITLIFKFDPKKRRIMLYLLVKLQKIYPKKAMFWIRIHVFVSPGSGSISQRYGSRSGSFNIQTKIVRKTLILTVF
jgi:hypothetical protein